MTEGDKERAVSLECPSLNFGAGMHLDLLDWPHGKALLVLRVGIDEYVFHLADRVVRQWHYAFALYRCVSWKCFDNTACRCSRWIL